MSNNCGEKSDLLFDQNAFSERLLKLIGRESARSFAKRTGMSDTGLKRYLFDGSEPSVSKLIAIANASAEKYGLSPAAVYLWLSCVEDSLSNFNPETPSGTSHFVSESIQPAYASDAITWIDSYEVFASAGNGFSNDSEALGNRLPFAESWLAENGLHGKKLALIRSIGDSMSPTIPNRSTPLIEILPDDAIERISDGVYVLRLNGQLLIKRLQSDLANGLFVKSDNPQYSPIHITADNYPDDFKVIARWTGKCF